MTKTSVLRAIRDVFPHHGTSGRGRRLWARRSILCHRAIATALIIASNILRTLAAAGFALLLAMTAGAGLARAQDDNLDDLNRQVAELYQAGKYAEATPIAERVLALAVVTLSPFNADSGMQTTP